VGSVVGIVAAQELHEATVGVVIANAEDHTRMEAAKAQLWGPKMANALFSGTFKTNDDGTYGRIRLTIKSGTVNCTITGRHGSGDIAASCSGAMGPDGAFSAPVGGSVTYKGPLQTTRTPFGGTVTGRIGFEQASGTFTTAGEGKTVSGDWTAPRM
jgi:hypothetical protein